MARTMKIAAIVSIAASAVFGTVAHGSCIVSGDTTRDSAISAPTSLSSSVWFDSSFGWEFPTSAWKDFSSYPVGFWLIFR